MWVYIYIYTIPRIRSVLLSSLPGCGPAGLVSELPCAHTQTWEFQSIPQTQTLKTAANGYFSANLGKDTIHVAIQGSSCKQFLYKSSCLNGCASFLIKCATEIWWCGDDIMIIMCFLVMMDHAIVMANDRMPSFFMETPPETIRNTTSIIYCLPVSDNLPLW